MKKLEQAVKDVEYYRQEAENLRTRYNDVILEKQRLDQEVLSLRRYESQEQQTFQHQQIFILFYLKLIQFFVCRFLDEDRKEMSELRRQHQELLNVEVRKFAEKLLISNSLKGVSKKFLLQHFVFQGGPNESMSIMYGTLLRKYETVKDDFGLLSKRYFIWCICENLS